MITVKNLTKQYKNTTVVDDLTFDISPGEITGFLGPNGAGKSTTMRMILGLDEPTKGSAMIDGKHYHDFTEPLKKVGSLLDASAVHPKMTARTHLEALCLSNGIPTSAVMHWLSIVGLKDVADKKVGQFSLGMRQRVGLAAALLGDPEYVLLDEPVNGLDPEGIRWVREEFLIPLAKEGRGVFVSSHQLGELSKMSNHLVVIGNGKMISNETTEKFIDTNTTSATIMRTSDDKRLMQVLHHNKIRCSYDDSQGVVITGMDNKALGDLALRLNLAVYGMHTEKELEEAFLSATKNSTVHKTQHVDNN